MRSRWVVCYDIANAARWRSVYRALRGYGDWIQLSVFRCDLSAKERVVLGSIIEELIDHRADQVLFLNLGPTEGRGAETIESIGRPLASRERAIVL